MRLSVVPGWIKLFLLFMIAAGFVVWDWSGSRPSADSDAAVVYSRPQFNPGAGLPGQAQANVRQLFVNPLEQAASVPEGEGGTLRDGARNYYKDE